MTETTTHGSRPFANSEGPALLTAAQVAHRLSVSVRHVYDLCDTGQLTRRYIGKGSRNFRIEAGDVADYIAGLPTEPLDEDPGP